MLSSLLISAREQLQGVSVVVAIRSGRWQSGSPKSIAVSREITRRPLRKWATRAVVTIQRPRHRWRGRDAGAGRAYPVATVAFYGPDDTRATKVSVGIVAHEGADVDPVERWFCKATDARIDPEVTEAIVRFIDQHGAKSVVAVDRIIGCPHEEGIDYPEGEKCTQCSFWANRDRWSGEIIQ